MAPVDREALRLLVREALREALGAGGKSAPSPSANASTSPPPKAGELAQALHKAVSDGRRTEISVAMGSRDDLDRFARTIAEASAEPGIKAAILGGRIAFVPIGAGPPPAQAVPSAPAAQRQAPTGGTFEMKTGVLSETRVVEIGRNHRRIVLGAEVVLTPLARDKAREMKIELARQKP
jgi:pyruvate/2-oxoglutarate dehydrogenase complex dihydrolipoamide acyltransferase (E2) component